MKWFGLTLGLGIEMLGLGLFRWDGMLETETIFEIEKDDMFGKDTILGIEWEHSQAGHSSKGYRYRQSAITSSKFVAIEAI